VQDRVIGILDWELSTLGNQMTDVAYSCLVLTQISSSFYMERVFPLFCFLPYGADASLSFLMLWVWSTKI
jgi:acyl-CoA dehydrogenase